MAAKKNAAKKSSNTKSISAEAKAMKDQVKEITMELEKVDAEGITEVKTAEPVKTKRKNKGEETFENGKKSLIRRIWDVVFWILFACLLLVWIVDFVQVKRTKEPIFCLKEVVHKYDDGTTTECYGLGYKVYTYDRESLSVKSQFTPFFVGMEE